jgi:hypothetical protein
MRLISEQKRSVRSVFKSHGCLRSSQAVLQTQIRFGIFFYASVSFYSKCLIRLIGAVPANNVLPDVFRLLQYVTGSAWWKSTAAVRPRVARTIRFPYVEVIIYSSLQTFSADINATERYSAFKYRELSQ